METLITSQTETPNPIPPMNPSTPKDPMIVSFKGTDKDLIRLSYPHLFEPRAQTGDDGKATGEPKFSAAFLFKKGSPQIDIAKKVMKACAVAKWGEKDIPKSLQLCLRDGDTKDSDGYEGCMFLSTSAQATRPPKVTNSRLVEVNPKTGTQKEVPYGGCYVHFSVRFWAQDNKFGKRINAELRVVVFHKDGEPFGAGPVNVEDDFGDILPKDMEELSSDSPASKDDDPFA